MKRRMREAKNRSITISESVIRQIDYSKLMRGIEDDLFYAVNLDELRIQI